MKTAQQVAEKYASRASAASTDYVSGVETTTKDQAARAIASAEIHKQATMAALNEGRYAKGLQKAGNQAWKDGVRKKGGGRYSEGVATASGKYAANSAAYDGARGAAASLPRGLKGSETNLARVKAVVGALRAVKAGK